MEREAGQQPLQGAMVGFAKAGWHIPHAEDVVGTTRLGENASVQSVSAPEMIVYSRVFWLRR